MKIWLGIGQARCIAEARSNKSTPLPDRVLDALDEHWRHVTRALSDPTHRRGERHAFLQQWLNRGVDINGLAWPHLPYTQRGAE